jgi:hypothetical protein
MWGVGNNPRLEGLMMEARIDELRQQQKRQRFGISDLRSAEGLGALSGVAALGASATLFVLDAFGLLW